jgi:hypothetical protein
MSTPTELSDIAGLAAGEYGSKAITGTGAVTPATGYYFAALHAMADTVVAAQGNLDDAVNATLSSITSIPAGSILFGQWNSITLTSGQMIAYYKKL